MVKKLDISIEDVRACYDEISIELFEMMYSDDYLSIGGMESTDILAKKAGITKESQVLDVGSGLGGPAFYLAKTYGCRVTGLDVNELSFQEAGKRARARRLDHLVNFKLGTAMDMPFRARAFNVVWGQDAWCHVTDKDRLIQECYRVLEPDGTIAFTDWLQKGEMDEEDRNKIFAQSACPYMETLEGYVTLLEKNGFSDVEKEDISQVFLNQYRNIINNLQDIEDKIANKFSPKVYQIVLEKNSFILKAFEEKKIGGGRFIGKKRGE